jgi:probable HAF family extracellular repeat protein
MKIAHALLPAVLLFMGPASAQVFTVTDLGPNVFPVGVSARGLVAATNNGAPGGVVWSRETGFRELTPLPTFPRSFPQAMNGRGDVVGYSEEEETDSFQATLWPHPTDSPFGLTPSVDTNTSANAINDRREITGDLDCCRSFVWTHTTGAFDIGPPPAGITFYEANAISEDETVAGSMGGDTSSTAFYWTKEKGIKAIPIPSSFATGIRRGFVIGASSCLKPSLCDGSTLRAFIWNRHFGPFDLGTLPGDNISEPSGINSDFLVVGASQNNSTGTSTAFLWVPVFGMIDLNQLIKAKGWTLDFATGINDKADIVGYGTLNGETHGFLLTVARRRR